MGHREQSVLRTARRQTRPCKEWRLTVTAPAPIPITLEHVLSQIGVVKKQKDVLMKEPEAEQSASIAKIDENGEPNF